MPHAHGENSAELHIAAGGGKIRDEIDADSAAPGRAGGMDAVSRTADEGGGGSVRQGDNAGEGDLFRSNAGQEISAGMERGGEDGSGRQRLLFAFFRATGAPKGEAAFEYGSAGGDGGLGPGMEKKGKFQGDHAEIKGKEAECDDKNEQNYTPRRNS